MRYYTVRITHHAMAITELCCIHAGICMLQEKNIYMHGKNIVRISAHATSAPLILLAAEIVRISMCAQC